MGRLGRFVFPVLILVSIVFLILPTLPAQDINTQGTNPNQTTDINKNDNRQQVSNRGQTRRKLEKDGQNPYKAWLFQDVPYIITEEERHAFLCLQSDQEREQFIEQFWLRRDPTPDTRENEFKEEHYRRIAYANAHFATGVPGWKTDRGRIYIIWGPPDEIESHPTGGTYERPESQGGGTTWTFPFEQWTYRHMEGIGDNVALCFVDPTMSGNYRLSADPDDKDALAHVPHSDLAIEAMPLQPRGRESDGNGASPRIESIVVVNKPPSVRFKDLEEIISSRIQRNDIKFGYRFDYLRVTAYTTLVPITVEIPNGQLSFQEKDGVHRASLKLFARILTLTARVVETFEDVIPCDFLDSQLEQSLKGDSTYQKTVPLSPGLYRLDIVLKDVNSNNVGVASARLGVPGSDDDTLDASTLILTDQTQPMTPNQITTYPFVIGDTEVHPKITQSFTSGQPLGVYLQIYNLKVDDTSHKNQASIAFRLTKNGQDVMTHTETSEQLQQTGNEITIQDAAALNALTPGQYHLEIQTTDQISKQTVKRDSDFMIVSPAASAAPELTPGK